MTGPTILFCLFLVGMTTLDLVLIVRGSATPATDPQVGEAFVRFMAALVFTVISCAFILFVPEAFLCP